MVFSHKKAQGLPITTIIIAILAIIVLVVMFAIFTGRISLFGRALSICPGRCAGDHPAGAAWVSQDSSSLCDAETEKYLPGRYAKEGQDVSKPQAETIVCDACCISLGTT